MNLWPTNVRKESWARGGSLLTARSRFSGNFGLFTILRILATGRAWRCGQRDGTHTLGKSIAVSAEQDGSVKAQEYGVTRLGYAAILPIGVDWPDWHSNSPRNKHSDTPIPVLDT